MQKKRESEKLTIWTHTEEITWYSVRDKLPDYIPDQRGTQVLIWPPHVSPGSADAHVAFFSNWISPSEACFYLCGATIEGVENWAYLPKGFSAATTGKTAKKATKRTRKKETT